MSCVHQCGIVCACCCLTLCVLLLHAHTQPDDRATRRRERRALFGAEPRFPAPASPTGEEGILDVAEAGKGRVKGAAWGRMRGREEEGRGEGEGDNLLLG